MANKLVEKVENIQANIKNRQRKAVASSGPIQLPLWSEKVRGLPNDLARSSLFRVGGKKEPRLQFRRHQIATIEGVSISLTGEELRQDDLDCFLQCIHLARQAPLGDHIDVSGHSLLKALNWDTSKKGYVRLKTCIERLQEASITLEAEEGTRGYKGQLLRKIAWENTENQGAKWRIYFEREIIHLFGPTNYSLIEWEQRLALSHLSKWLHGFWLTHAQPFPYKVETLRTLCGTKIQQLSQFRRKLKEALEELTGAGFLESWRIDARTDLVHVVRSGKKALRGQDKKADAAAA